MARTRPTLRALREDLKLPVPPLDVPLDEVDHPALAKAAEQFADPNAGHERIRAVDDQVLFKVKVQRWRGEVWTDATAPWLVAAGTREAGSPDDFYAALASEAQAARSRYNREHSKPIGADTYVGPLLPGRDDYDRYAFEANTRLRRQIRDTVRHLVRASLRDGHEHTAHQGGYVLGIQVRADHGHETYVAVRIVGDPPADLVGVILARVPGCDLTTWTPDTMPDRKPKGNEQIWSTVMDPAAAAKLLDQDDTDTAR